MNSLQVQSYFLDETPPGSVSVQVEQNYSCFTVDPDQRLLVSVDTLISGVHFPENTAAEAIAHKALAVNLSDIAAMGGEAVAYTLNLSAPSWDKAWLQSFRNGLFQLASKYNVSLLSCIAESGPLSITIQIFGKVPQGEALLRSTAKEGDRIFVSGSLGDAAAALDLIVNQRGCESSSRLFLEEKLNLPTPRLELGLLLRGIASAAIDISDGFLADLGHILEKSGKGAIVNMEDIPLSSSLLSCFDRKQALDFALSGGDDYELCFTVPVSKLEQLENIVQTCKLDCTCVGDITGEPGLMLKDAAGQLHSPARHGFDHFR